MPWHHTKHLLHRTEVSGTVLQIGVPWIIVSIIRPASKWVGLCQFYFIHNVLYFKYFYAVLISNPKLGIGAADLRSRIAIPKFQTVLFPTSFCFGLKKLSKGMLQGGTNWKASVPEAYWVKTCRRQRLEFDVHNSTTSVLNKHSWINVSYNISVYL